MFEKSLTDLIRGIRANKKNEQKYIAACIQECRQEVKNNDHDVKATAILKLTYLQMHGYDMSWASFNVVEVMSSTKFLQKRSGYLAATQSFRQDTDVLMLTTNLLKKLFLKYPEALRLSFPRLKEKLDDPDPSVVCSVVNVICELARKNPKNYLSLAPQLFKILNSSSNNWMLIKIIKLFGALTPLEPRLAKKLLPSITQQIQTTQAMSLLYECIHTVITGGMLNLGGSSDSLAAMCVNKLRIFLEDQDQNSLAKILPTHPKLVSEHKDIILKCIDDLDISIRLRALDLVVGMVNKKNCADIIKRLMAHLLPSSNSDPSTSYPPPSTLLEPAYRENIINRIIYICSQNSYSNITNFEWYIAVLVDLTYVAEVNVGVLLAQQIMDVGVRVKSVRKYCVKIMQRLISDSTLLENCKLLDSNAEVLYAAAWISGEFCSYLENHVETIEFLVQPGVTKLSHSVQAVYIHAVLKIYSYWANSLIYNWDDDAKQELIQITAKLKDKIGIFGSCTDLEVQERAYNIREIFSIIHQNLVNGENNFQDENVYSPAKAPTIITELSPLFFSYELNPVAPKAQKKVPIPEGLDLDAWINEPLPVSESSESEEEEESYGYGYGQKFGGSGDLIFSSGNGTTVGRRRGRKNGRKGGYESEENEEILEKRLNERRERIKNDPYYINVDDKKAPLKLSKSVGLTSPRKIEEIDVDSIPVVRLSMNEFDFKSNKKFSGKSKRSKGTKKTDRRSPSPPSMPPVIYTDIGEMPENATISDDEKEAKNNIVRQTVWNSSEKNGGILDVDFSGVANVDLSTPLGEDEKFPQMRVYLSPEEVRRVEEEKRTKMLLEAAQLKKNKSDKSKSKSGSQTSSKITSNSTSKARNKRVENEEKPIKKKKVSKKKNTDETGPMKKSKKTGYKKKSKKKSASEQVIFENIQDTNGPYEIIKMPVKTLLDLDELRVSYTLHLGTDIEIKNEPPVIIAEFTLQNKISDNSLTQLSFTFESTSDIQFENASLEIGELQSNEQKEIHIEFKVLGIVGVRLNVSGNVSYTTPQLDEEEATIHDIPIKFELPLSVFMLNLPKITPEQFSSIVSDSSKFPFSGSTLIQLNPTDRTFEQTFQDELIRLTSIATGTRIVQEIPSAITIYGKSVQGYQVAGLAKLFIEQNVEENELNDHNIKANIRIEIKCTEQAFMDGLIREIDNMFKEIL
ncbi:3859_t:CDS:10 [Funneliformis geosporum]|uniref:3859_t:CDS:1 n=1 Tax=Funneliformis geosporum TaxID=1117311 RepID=A0A9W4SUM6_9GLOM|nr:3859_t:CDS:10 [Funneliformis geosporum]